MCRYKTSAQLISVNFEMSFGLEAQLASAYNLLRTGKIRHRLRSYTFLQLPFLGGTLTDAIDASLQLALGLGLSFVLPTECWIRSPTEWQYLPASPCTLHFTVMDDKYFMRQPLLSTFRALGTSSCLECFQILVVGHVVRIRCHSQRTTSSIHRRSPEPLSAD